MDGEYLRLIIFAVLACLWSGLRSWRLGKVLDNGHFTEVAWAIGGTVFTSGLLVKAVTDEQLRAIIGIDGCLALFVGAGSQVISSLGLEMKRDVVHLTVSIKSSARYILKRINP